MPNIPHLHTTNVNGFPKRGSFAGSSFVSPAQYLDGFDTISLMKRFFYSAAAHRKIGGAQQSTNKTSQRQSVITLAIRPCRGRPVLSILRSPDQIGTEHGGNESNSKLTANERISSFSSSSSSSKFSFCSSDDEDEEEFYSPLTTFTGLMPLLLRLGTPSPTMR